MYKYSKDINFVAIKDNLSSCQAQCKVVWKGIVDKFQTFVCNINIGIGISISNKYSQFANELQFYTFAIL